MTFQAVSLFIGLALLHTHFVSADFECGEGAIRFNSECYLIKQGNCPRDSIFIRDKCCRENCVRTCTADNCWHCCDSLGSSTAQTAVGPCNQNASQGGSNCATSACGQNCGCCASCMQCGCCGCQSCCNNAPCGGCQQINCSNCATRPFCSQQSHCGSPAPCTQQTNCGTICNQMNGQPSNCGNCSGSSCSNGCGQQTNCNGSTCNQGGCQQTNCVGSTTNQGCGQQTNCGGSACSQGCGQQTVCGSHTSQDCVQQTNCGGQQTNCGGQQTNCGGQQTNCGGQQTNCGGQLTNCGGQQTNCGGQQTNCGGNCNTGNCPVPPVTTPTTSPPSPTDPSTNTTPTPTTAPVTTTPPPATIACPPGTIPMGRSCRPIYCPRGAIMRKDECITLLCPAGTVWIGHKCAIPEPITQNLTFINTIITQTNETKADIVLNSVNSFNINVPVVINNMEALCDGEMDEECDKSSTTEKAPIVEKTTEQPLDKTNSTKCCTVMTPRTCERRNNRWYCYSRRYQRCGDFCMAPVIYLKPPRVYSRPGHMVVPPLASGCNAHNDCGHSTDGFDCSGCALGLMETCSYYCYRYSCPMQSCGYYDQQTYCINNPGSNGCMVNDGCFDMEWCS